MADDPMTPEDRDVLAAELALGILEGADRARALRLHLADAEFRAEVDVWENRLITLALSLSEEAAPATLWPAIEARLAAVEPGNAVVLAERRLARWRVGALASGALALILAFALMLRPASPPPASNVLPVQDEQSIVAQLGSPQGDAEFVASYDPAQAKLRIRPVLLPPSDLVPELWVIPAGGSPLSLGLFAADGSSTVDVSEALRQHIAEGASLAVSLESREGAPHEAPSSTPIAVGLLHRL